MKTNNAFLILLYSPFKSEPENDDFYHSPKHEKSLKRERDDDE